MPWSVSARLALIALASPTAGATAGAAATNAPAAIRAAADSDAAPAQQRARDPGLSDQGLGEGSWGDQRRGEVPLPPEAGAPSGPAGTSGMGAARYDQVGIASITHPASPASLEADAPVVAAHRHLRPGAVAEVTALDTGRTILVLIDKAPPPGAPSIEIDLSPRAAALLGYASVDRALVRVRSTVASAADLAALQAGRPAARRLDAPPALLAALRRQIAPARSVEAGDARAPQLAQRRRALGKPAPAPAPRKAAPQQRTAGKYLVQVAAVTSAARARELARALGGRVEAAGAVHRIRLGPFADRNSAQRARDAAKRRGYGDATILTQP